MTDEDAGFARRGEDRFEEVDFVVEVDLSVRRPFGALAGAIAVRSEHSVGGGERVHQATPLCG
jgi:hypothetical protein